MQGHQAAALRGLPGEARTRSRPRLRRIDSVTSAAIWRPLPTPGPSPRKNLRQWHFHVKVVCCLLGLLACMLQDALWCDGRGGVWGSAAAGYSRAPCALPGLQEGLVARAGQVDGVHLHSRQAACAARRCMDEGLQQGTCCSAEPVRTMCGQLGARMQV